MVASCWTAAAPLGRPPPSARRRTRTRHSRRRTGATQSHEPDGGFDDLGEDHGGEAFGLTRVAFVNDGAQGGAGAGVHGFASLPAEGEEVFAYAAEVGRAFEAGQCGPESVGGEVRLGGPAAVDGGFAGLGSCGAAFHGEAVPEVVLRGISRGEVRPDADHSYVLDVIPAMMMYRSNVCGSEWAERDVEELIDRPMLLLLRPDRP